MIAGICIFLGIIGFSVIGGMSTSSKHHVKSAIEKRIVPDKSSFNPLNEAVKNIRAILDSEKKKPYAISLVYKMNGDKPICQDKRIYFKEYRKKPLKEHTSFLKDDAHNKYDHTLKYIYKPCKKNHLIQIYNRSKRRYVSRIELPLTPPYASEKITI